MQYYYGVHDTVLPWLLRLPGLVQYLTKLLDKISVTY